MPWVGPLLDGLGTTQRVIEDILKSLFGCLFRLFGSGIAPAILQGEFNGQRPLVLAQMVAMIPRNNVDVNTNFSFERFTVLLF